MGKLYKLKCTGCENEDEYFVGVGFNYPDVYQSIMDEAKAGRIGKRLKKFLEENPEGVIDPTLVLAYCPKCHEIYTANRLSCYLPLPGYKREFPRKTRWSSFKPYFHIDYVSPGDFTEHYSLVAPYGHRCSNCRSKMLLIDENDLDSFQFRCSCCQSRMELENSGSWD